MNQPPDSGMNTPPGYDAPQQPPGYGQPQSGPVPNSGSYQPPPQGRTGFTRQIFSPAMYRQPGSGSYAAASLILAIVGWVTLGCLGTITWPLAIILGLLGLVGNKRAKGMSFAGVLLSAAGIAAFVAFFALGFYVQFQGSKMAEQGGKPVVAAIEDFKTDHKRVPHNLDELVTEGYLPPTWDQGLDNIDSHVQDVVKGKKWQDFLAYKEGAGPEWKGTPQTGSSNTGAGDEFDDFNFNVDDNTPPADTGSQTYGLSFVGIDGKWGTTDDEAVNQSPEEPYDLTDAWGGDSKTRDFAQKRRDLKRLSIQLKAKAGQYQAASRKAHDTLADTDAELRQVIQRKGLDSYDKVQADVDGRSLLKIIGAQQKLVLLADRKLKNTRDKLTTIGYQVRMLETQEDMAKLADNPKEMAELATLLDETEKVLNTGGDLGELDKLDEDTAAKDWFNNNFK